MCPPKNNEKYCRIHDFDITDRNNYKCIELDYILSIIMFSRLSRHLGSISRFLTKLPPFYYVGADMEYGLYTPPNRHTADQVPILFSFCKVDVISEVIFLELCNFFDLNMLRALKITKNTVGVGGAHMCGTSLYIP